METETPLDRTKQIKALETIMERLWLATSKVPHCGESDNELFSRIADAAKQCARRIENLKGIKVL